ncbi:MAG: hypothetical protein ABR521_13460 [Gaiellaceae bacterium]
MTLAIRAVYAAAVTLVFAVLLARGEPGGAIAVLVGGTLLRRAADDGRLLRLVHRFKPI